MYEIRGEKNNLSPLNLHIFPIFSQPEQSLESELYDVDDRLCLEDAYLGRGNFGKICNISGDLTKLHHI